MHCSFVPYFSWRYCRGPHFTPRCNTLGHVLKEGLDSEASRVSSIEFPHAMQGNGIQWERGTMKKLVAVLTLVLAFGAGVVSAQRVHDWRDLDAVQRHISQAINGMERARAANHYDMDGHGLRAEEHLRAAEREVNLAISARAN